MNSSKSFCSSLKKASNRQVPGFTKLEEGAWTGPYSFIHGADPQLGFISVIKGEKGETWDEEVELLRQGISAMNKMQPKPRFFFICGDLVDAEPSKELRNRAQSDSLMQTLSECEIPIFVISGNHDIENKPTPSSIKYFKDRYGDDYYSFYVGGVFYIALNSQYFMDPSEVPTLAEEQRSWLDEQLKLAKKSRTIRHVVVFMHIPLFLVEPDEKNQYFNIPKELRLNLLEAFGNAGVSFVFSGHYHRCAGGVWTGADKEKTMKIEVVVTSAIGAQLGKDKSGMSVVRVAEEEITHQYYAMEDLPLTFDLE